MEETVNPVLGRVFMVFQERRTDWNLSESFKTLLALAMTSLVAMQRCKVDIVKLQDSGNVLSDEQQALMEAQEQDLRYYALEVKTWWKKLISHF